MNTDDYEIITEAQNLITAVKESLNPQNPLYQDHFAIDGIEHKELALQFICMMNKDALATAKMAFSMGVYLGIQHKKLKEIEKSL